MALARSRSLAVVEGIVVFLAASFLFRWISSSPIQRLITDRFTGGGIFWLEYLGLLLGLLAYLKLRGQGLAAFGLSFKNPRAWLKIVAAGVLPFLAFGLLLTQVNWRKAPGALLISAAAIGLLLLLSNILSGKFPSGVRSLSLIVLWFIPVLSQTRASPVLDVLIKTIYVYLLVGPAEELLFRGFLHTRFNVAFGTPYHFFGVCWGGGTILASTLFGLWHVMLMPASPGVGWQALWTGLIGLSFAYLREKSNSLYPSALLHSMMNYVPFAEWL